MASNTLVGNLITTPKKTISPISHFARSTTDKIYSDSCSAKQNMHVPATGGHRPAQSIVAITKHRCDGDVRRIIPATVTNTGMTERCRITDTC